MQEEMRLAAILCGRHGWYIELTYYIQDWCLYQPSVRSSIDARLSEISLCLSDSSFAGGIAIWERLRYLAFNAVHAHTGSYRAPWRSDGRPMIAMYAQDSFVASVPTQQNQVISEYATQRIIRGIANQHEVCGILGDIIAFSTRNMSQYHVRQFTHGMVASIIYSLSQATRNTDRRSVVEKITDPDLGEDLYVTV